MKTMKKTLAFVLATLLMMSLATVSPAEVVSDAVTNPYPWNVLENAVSVRIGRNDQSEHSINVYDNDAAATMLNYLSDTPLQFPAYTYEEEAGFVAQDIRGTYSRDDEVMVENILAGELYLLSGNQLRLYFKDVQGANITATPVGRFAETDGLTATVQEAYTSNLGDTWGVSVYFWITRHLQ